MANFSKCEFERYEYCTQPCSYCDNIFTTSFGSPNVNYYQALNSYVIFSLYFSVAPLACYLNIQYVY